MQQGNHTAGIYKGGQIWNRKRDTRAVCGRIVEQKVEVIVYRLYAVDEKEAHLIQNEGFQENEMFYI